MTNSFIAALPSIRRHFGRGAVCQRPISYLVSHTLPHVTGRSCAMKWTRGIERTTQCDHAANGSPMRRCSSRLGGTAYKAAPAKDASARVVIDWSHPASPHTLQSGDLYTKPLVQVPSGSHHIRTAIVTSFGRLFNWHRWWFRGRRFRCFVAFVSVGRLVWLAIAILVRAHSYLSQEESVQAPSHLAAGHAARRYPESGTRKYRRHRRGISRKASGSLRSQRCASSRDFSADRPP
jgi:hypothetical protein